MRLQRRVIFWSYVKIGKTSVKLNEKRWVDYNLKTFDVVLVVQTNGLSSSLFANRPPRARRVSKAGYYM